jgi:predicted amidohydrolase
MRIGYYQYSPEFGSPSKNLENVQDTLSGINADIIVLPELAFTGYFFENRKELKGLAEDVSNSQTVKRLSNLCQDNDFHLVAGFAERHKEKLYNSALVIGPSGLVATYRKLHLFNTEKEYFDPGNTPLRTLDIGGTKIGVMICFDWAFPEVARVLALQGADLICHPSNLVLTHCQKAMLTRSLENSVYSITANRTGKESRPSGQLLFTGNSQIVGPKGNILSQSDAKTDEVVVQEIEPAAARDKSITANNDLFSDRRPEFYTSIVP